MTVHKMVQLGRRQNLSNHGGVVNAERPNQPRNGGLHFA
eukprot:CAMPEP_0185005606 /NCGR_PEP_ID=MMETSP1098-20130426/82354_1 /TAXON_ID=89044 /ORGANISM="Spumella elongata, Strain CCAP 955/1" /LENGTH=38 /DNA_ID= /DNA_START= /DNA_END= /DNA_ORIENTATION=